MAKIRTHVKRTETVAVPDQTRPPDVKELTPEGKKGLSLLKWITHVVVGVGAAIGIGYRDKDHPVPPTTPSPQVWADRQWPAPMPDTIAEVMTSEDTASSGDGQKAGEWRAFINSVIAQGQREVKWLPRGHRVIGFENMNKFDPDKIEYLKLIISSPSCPPCMGVHMALEDQVRQGFYSDERIGVGILTEFGLTRGEAREKGEDMEVSDWLAKRGVKSWPTEIILKKTEKGWVPLTLPQTVNDFQALYVPQSDARSINLALSLGLDMETIPGVGTVIKGSLNDPNYLDFAVGASAGRGPGRGFFINRPQSLYNIHEGASDEEVRRIMNPPYLFSTDNEGLGDLCKNPIELAKKIDETGKFGELAGMIRTAETVTYDEAGERIRVLRDGEEITALHVMEERDRLDIYSPMKWTLNEEVREIGLKYGVKFDLDKDDINDLESDRFWDRVMKAAWPSDPDGFWELRRDQNIFQGWYFDQMAEGYFANALVARKIFDLWRKDRTAKFRGEAEEYCFPAGLPKQTKQLLEEALPGRIKWLEDPKIPGDLSGLEQAALKKDRSDHAKFHRLAQEQGVYVFPDNTPAKVIKDVIRSKSHKQVYVFEMHDGSLHMDPPDETGRFPKGRDSLAHQWINTIAGLKKQKFFPEGTAFIIIHNPPGCRWLGGSVPETSTIQAPVYTRTGGEGELSVFIGGVPVSGKRPPTHVDHRSFESFFLRK